MKTTKFGLQISVFAAILYIGAIQSPLIPLLMVGYALLAENSEEMRKMSCQALTVLGSVWALNGIYTLLNQFVNFLNSFVGNGYLHMPYGLSMALTVIITVVPLVFAALALAGRYAFLTPAPMQRVVTTVQAPVANAAAASHPDQEETKQ